jgi:hypothetical protein
MMNLLEFIFIDIFLINLLNQKFFLLIIIFYHSTPIFYSQKLSIHKPLGFFYFIHSLYFFNYY